MASLLDALCKWHEETNQEKDDNKQNEDDSVLESTPDSCPNCLCTFLRRCLVIFLKEEVREGYDKQTQNSI